MNNSDTLRMLLTEYQEREEAARIASQQVRESKRNLVSAVWQHMGDYTIDRGILSVNTRALARALRR